MKATLLIKNIKNLYTCNDAFDVISNAFIAIHHEFIIDFGSHDFNQWMDDSTRVIDAQGECVVPSFIDSCYRCNFKEQTGDQIRTENESAFALRKSGILTMATPYSQLQRKDLYQDIIKKKLVKNIPVISTIQEYEKNPTKAFLLSCGVGSNPYSIYSMHPLAFYLFNVLQIDAASILKSMTSWPSQECGFHDRGMIDNGMRADLLVLHIDSIEHYFKTLGIPLIRRMIKNGIPIYPDLIRC